MDTQLKKGLLEALVLSVLTDGASYGYKIIQDLQPITTFSESTLYPVLRRLESQGYVDTYSEQFSGRLRKYYEINKSGKQRLRLFADEWDDVNRIVGYIIQRSYHG